MFPTEPVMTAIHADRLREIEELTRQRRLLAADEVECTGVAPGGADEPAGSIPGRMFDIRRRGRAAGSACEPA